MAKGKQSGSEQAEELEALLMAELLSLAEEGSGLGIRTTFMESTSKDAERLNDMLPKFTVVLNLG